MKSKDKITMVGWAVAVCAIFTVVALSTATKLGYTEVGEYQVESVERVRDTYTDSYVYMVTTDGGVFKIELSGLNAYAYGAGLIKAGNSYVLKTRGARIERFGLYPNIINVIEEDDEN